MNKIFKSKKIIRALVITLELLVLALIIYLVALPFYPAIKYKISSNQNQNIDYKDIDAVKKITEEIIKKSTSIAVNTSNTDSSARLRGQAQLSESIPETELEAIANGQSGNATNNINIEPQNNLTAADSDVNEEQSENSKSEATSAKTTLTFDTSSSDESINIRNTLIIPKIGVDIPIIESDSEEYGLDHGTWKLPKSSDPERGGNMILTGHRFKYLPPSNLTFYLFDKLEEGDIASVIWNNKSYFYRIKEVKTIGEDDASILKQTKSQTLTMYTCDPIYSTKNRLVVIAELIEEGY